MRGLLLALATFMCLISGCGQRPTPHGAPEPQPASGALMAGAAKVDITPLAGVPLGGHSVESATGYAVWTRLWARAIYLEDEHGEPLVLAVADLWAIPAGLADAVVARVRDHHGLTQIGRAQLLLSATHTHHSPGNFSTAKLYSRAASHRMGHDDQLFDFLTKRIADAVAQAVNARAPARLRLDTRPVPALARNRSVTPFMQNPEAALIVAHNRDAGLPPCPDALRDGDDRSDAARATDLCHAVDPTLTSLRIEDRSGRPIAIAAFIAVHATSMLNETHAYNGDLFAVATARAEAALAAAWAEPGSGNAPESTAGSDPAPGADPVVALFNGPEGDVSPNWSAQGRPAALALGGLLGDAIIDAGVIGSSGELIAGAIESGFERVRFARQRVAGPPAATTARRALGGKAMLGGAEDGRTRYHQRHPEGQTTDRTRRLGQGPKRPAVPPSLFSLYFPRVTIPQQAPASIHRVGPLTFVGLPGEFTTVMGMRIRQAVAANSPPGAPRPVAIGLAGEYLSYFATPEEYALQHYEGGSTLWGQYAGTLVAEHLASLARAVAPDHAPVASHSAGLSAPVAPGLRRRFALRPGARANRATRDLASQLHTQFEIDTPLDALPRVQFETGAPTWAGLTWPELQIETRDANGDWVPLRRDGAVIDERGAELLMFPVEVERYRWVWELWWIGAPPPGQPLRIHAWGPDGPDACSTVFEAGTAPSLQTVACDPPAVTR